MRPIRKWRDDDKVARIWARDPSVWTGSGEQDWLGWLDVASDEAAHADRFSDLVDDVRSAGFTDAVVLGMGGSSLCPDVLATTFPPQAGLPRLRVLDSTDPQQVKAMQEVVDLAHDSVLRVFEVGHDAGAKHLRRLLLRAHARGRGQGSGGIALHRDHRPGSPLEDLGAASAISRRLRGRALDRRALLGALRFRDGPRRGRRHRRRGTPRLCRRRWRALAPRRHRPATTRGLVLGAVIGACANAGRDKLTLLTSPGVTRLGAWLEQLLAESTGKQGRGVIPVDGEPVGTPEVYGTDRLFAYIRLASDDDDAQDAKVSALEKAGHPVVRIELSDPHGAGRRVLPLGVRHRGGRLVDRDQPVRSARRGGCQGARAGDHRPLRRNRARCASLTPFVEKDGLRLYADDANRAELVEMAGEGADVPAYLAAHLSRAGAGDYVALLAYVEMTTEHEAALRGIRAPVRDARRVATCVGFGPRFQHSTGQAYKGGPNTGVFLQITCDDTVNLAVPGHRYSFGVVKEAEARSDLDVLAARGRRVLRLHIGADVGAGLERLAGAVVPR